MSNPPSYFTILNDLYAKFTQYLFILNRNLFNWISNSIDFVIFQYTHERIEDIYQYILCSEVCLSTRDDFYLRRQRQKQV